MAPKILIATTCRWFSAARIAIAFDRAGCTVDVICPPRHPVLSTRIGQQPHPYRALTAVRSFRRAILSCGPDFIVPCDDLAMRHLHRLYDLTTELVDDSSQGLRDLLQRSLGNPDGYPIMESRDEFMAMVDVEGIRAPETKTVASATEVEEWLSRFGFPAVLKADGTSGGEGVKIVRTLPEALRAYRTLRAPVPTVVVLKRVCLDGDWNSVIPLLSQQKRAVSIQSFITGPDANVAVACWNGEVLASVSVEVLQTWKPKGPATIVRILKNNEMDRAVDKMVRRLKFSGLCGFDFMIDKTTGDAYLIEMNPRATQTCTLPLGTGPDLIASICSRLTGQTHHAMPLQSESDTAALFPLAWHGDTSSDLFQSAYHDVPWDEPELARQGFEQQHPSHEKWKELFSRIGLHH